MAHIRNRYLAESFEKTSQFSPLVGVIGHRQVGKTTFISSRAHHYFTLDDPDELAAALSSAKLYIAERASNAVAIDECQEVPALFPVLKDWVRTHKKPGQFFLTGSVRFTSFDLIKESLTGRIMTLELLPFTVSEMEKLPLSQRVLQALSAEHLISISNLNGLPQRKMSALHALVKKYYRQGGLPGSCFIQNDGLRTRRFEQQLLTILDRDLRKVARVKTPYPQIRSLVRELARTQGIPVDYTSLKKATQISVPTIKKLISGLEVIFLIRRVMVEGGKKGESFYFEDQGESNHLFPEKDERALLTHFCFTHFRTQFEYSLKTPFEVFQYRTRGGVVVPLVYRTDAGVLGVIPLESIEEAPRALYAATSLLKTYPKAKVILPHLGLETKLLQPRVLVTPIAEWI